MLRVLTLNVLAPNFADPKYYPIGSYGHLSTEKRRNIIIRYLISVKNSFDIISLQEVTDDTVIPNFFGNLDTGTTHTRFGEYRFFISALLEFTSMFIPHDPSHWINYFGSTPELSYIRNGNAIFFRRSLFTCPIWGDIPMSTGNHAIIGTVIHRPSLCKLRVINIHLDNESNTTRAHELTHVISTIPYHPDIVDIIMGDFNTDIRHLSDILCDTKFKDTLYQFGDECLTYALVADKDGPIDRIIYRGSSVYLISTEVIGSSLWKRFPVINSRDPLASLRLNACIDAYGSDHFPVQAILMLERS